MSAISTSLWSLYHYVHQSWSLYQVYEGLHNEKFKSEINDLSHSVSLVLLNNMQHSDWLRETESFTATCISGRWGSTTWPQPAGKKRHVAGWVQRWKTTNSAEIFVKDSQFLSNIRADVNSNVTCQLCSIEETPSVRAALQCQRQKLDVRWSRETVHFLSKTWTRKAQNVVNVMVFICVSCRFTIFCDYQFVCTLCFLNLTKNPITSLPCYIWTHLFLLYLHYFLHHRYTEDMKYSTNTCSLMWQKRTFVNTSIYFILFLLHEGWLC